MWWLFLACVGTRTQPLEAPAHQPPAVSPTAPVGEAGWSFVYGSTLSGRTVFLMEFGSERPRFGHHGEPLGAEPTLRAWDTQTGESSALQDLIAVSADRRHALVQDLGGTWLIDDAGGWTQLQAVSAEGDGNRCLPPRQAAFSVDGSRVGWIDPGDSFLTVRDLESGAQWQVAAQSALWRAWPDNEGQGATLLELQEESESWPMQKTSCACRWCGMFALSYGVYGWAGPAFEMVHVDGEGERGEPIEEEGSGAMHGPNAQGCLLESAAPSEDPLQQGPWMWVCPE